MINVSTKPWSDYTAADYSIEQWHAACLIHIHEGTPTSKNECKLPVKTPAGVINKNGVHAAAAALAGARGGVHASPEKKMAAKRAIKVLYSKLDEDLPKSLKQSEKLVNNILSHFGVRGMKWGIRRKSKTPLKTSSEHKKISEIKKKKTPQLTNKQIKAANERMNLEQNFNRLNPSVKKRGQKQVKAILAALGAGGGAVGLYNTLNSKAGKAAIEAAQKVLKKQKTIKLIRKARGTQLKLPFD